MYEYPKTENLFKRDPDTHKLIVGEFREPAHEQVGRWLVTEKVDGTNIRILMRLKPEDQWVNGVDTMEVEVRGRSDRANLQGDLKDSIPKTLQANFETNFAFVHELTRSDPNVQVCLYGEGYGAGIQKVGKLYRADKSVRIFDVTTTHVAFNGDEAIKDGPTWWRDWPTVEAAAQATGLKTVPCFGTKTIDEIVSVVAAGFPSTTASEDGTGAWGAEKAEGLVARTDPYLYVAGGGRCMFKLKHEDL